MSQNHYYMPLPRQAGYVITSIGGKKCTAVPRSVQQSQAVSTPQPAQSTASPARSTAQAGSNSPGNNVSPTTRQAALPTSEPVDSITNQISSIATPLISVPTPEAIADNSLTQSRVRPTQSALVPGGISNGADNSTPLDSSSTRIPGVSPTSGGNTPKNTDDTTVVTSPQNPKNTGAIVGSTVGILGVLVILSVILFCCRRRRKKRKESESLLSPLPSANREKFYEIDSGSLGPSRKTTKWKREITSRAENAAYGFKMTIADIGDVLRDTVSRDRSDTPSVDLDRGNSQFFQGSVGQHTRNNSTLSEESSKSSLRDRLARWRGKFGEVWQPQKQGGRVRGLASQTNSMAESQINLHERYRDSDQSGSVTTSNLGLTLMNSHTSDLLRLENQPRDPFEDPYADEDTFRDSKMDIYKVVKPSERPLSNPFATGENPFSDPVITVPSSTIPKPQTYVQHVRRSRGSSFSSVPSNRSSQNSDLISFVDRPTSMTVTSPHAPSIFAPSHRSDRDTVYSSFSAERRGKGRSDPFDLDRADLYSRLSPKNRPNMPGQALESPNDTAPNVSRIKSMIAENKARGHHRYNSSIRYSSGVDSLEDWGDPDEAAEDSMRGNASSRASAGEYDKNDVRHGRPDSELGGSGVTQKPGYSNHKINGSLVEIKVNLGGLDGNQGTKG